MWKSERICKIMPTIPVFIEITKGEIRTRKEIWCGVCGCWEYLEHCGRGCFVIAEAKEKGWKRTRKYGWVCPGCSYHDMKC